MLCIHFWGNVLFIIRVRFFRPACYCWCAVLFCCCCNFFVLLASYSFQIACIVCSYSGRQFFVCLCSYARIFCIQCYSMRFFFIRFTVRASLCLYIFFSVCLFLAVVLLTCPRFFFVASIVPLAFVCLFPSFVSNVLSAEAVGAEGKKRVLSFNLNWWPCWRWQFRFACIGHTHTHTPYSFLVVCAVHRYPVSLMTNNWLPNLPNDLFGPCVLRYGIQFVWHKRSVDALSTASRRKKPTPTEAFSIESARNMCAPSNVPKLKIAHLFRIHWQTSHIRAPHSKHFLLSVERIYHSFGLQA